MSTSDLMNQLCPRAVKAKSLDHAKSKGTLLAVTFASARSWRRPQRMPACVSNRGGEKEGPEIGLNNVRFCTFTVAVSSRPRRGYVAAALACLAIVVLLLFTILMAVLTFVAISDFRAVPAFMALNFKQPAGIAARTMRSLGDRPPPS